MVTKSKDPMTEALSLPESWPNLHLRRSTQVPCSSTISLFVSRRFGIRRIRLTVIHLIRHIPEWLSCLSYRPLPRYGYKPGQEVLHGPMAFVKESIVRNWSAFRDV